MNSERRIRQRIRFTYGVDGPLKYVAVLDMMRIWGRLLRRADIPIAYSQGFHPQPRLQIAAPLPVGYSSECELIDAFLTQEQELTQVRDATKVQAPRGLDILNVENVPVKASAAQATMREAIYRVRIWTVKAAPVLKRRIQNLLSQSEIIRQRFKKGNMIDYDLRPLIHDIEYVHTREEYHQLRMRVRCSPRGAGRPEEIVDELDIEPTYYTIHRTHLIQKKEDHR
ncbi:MAG: TIGR03936 family radical SAM-associated protein [Chloroflexota bacterium]|nr:TIGR03936 family radical SAM-associated protein [Chloroflexota bacterium]